MALQVVTQLRALAAVEENRYFIVRDQGCLPALETLHFLSMCPGNREQMVHEKGLLHNLTLLTENEEERVRETALSTKCNLNTRRQPVNDENQNGQDACSPNQQTTSKAQPLQDSSNRQASLGIFASKAVTKNVKTARTFTVWVPGMVREDHRGEIEAVLVRIRGVVSFLLDVFSRKAIIRSLVPLEVLIDTIQQKTGFEVSLRPPTANESVGLEEAVEEEPDYLPDSEEVETGKMAVVSANEVPEKPAEAGWFGRIARSLWG